MAVRCMTSLSGLTLSYISVNVNIAVVVDNSQGFTFPQQQDSIPLCLIEELNLAYQGVWASSHHGHLSQTTRSELSGPGRTMVDFLLCVTTWLALTTVSVN